MRRALFALMCACGQLDATTPPTNATRTFALHDFFFGDTTRDGVRSNAAWKTFGRNVDGKLTDATSTDVCTLAPDAPAANQVDGDDGLDNAFGAVIVANAGTDDGPPLSAEITGALQAGASSLLIEVTGLSDDPQQTSRGLVARAFEGAPLGAPPAFDASTSWPVLSTSLVDGATLAGGAVATFPDAAIDHGVFDSGTATGPMRVSLPFEGAPTTLVIHEPRITFTHVGDEAAFGTLSGVVDVQELETTLRAIAGKISPSLCGSGFDGIADQIQQAADILHDGTNVPGVACDAISVGFGFDAKLIANPTEVVAAPPLVDDCP